jgi:dipeptidase E
VNHGRGVRALLTSAGLTNDELVRRFRTLTGTRRVATVAVVPASDEWTPSTVRNLDLVAHVVDVVDPSALGFARRIAAADVIVVGGGDVDELLRRLHDTRTVDELREAIADRVFMGVSAGSIVASRDVEWLYQTYGRPIGQRPIDALGIADVAVFPHKDAHAPELTKAFDDAVSTALLRAFEIDDDTAVMVYDGAVRLRRPRRGPRSDDRAQPPRSIRKVSTPSV